MFTGDLWAELLGYIVKVQLDVPAFSSCVGHLLSCACVSLPTITVIWKPEFLQFETEEGVVERNMIIDLV